MDLSFFFFNGYFSLALNKEKTGEPKAKPYCLMGMKY